MSVRRASSSARNIARLGCLSLVVLLLTGCSFVRIHNVSEHHATVRVSVPDNPRGYVRFIRSGNIVDVFTGHGGRYTITSLASEYYKQSLDNLRNQITTRLFEERGTLTAEHVRILTENLNHVDSLIEQSAQPGVSCTGAVADFDTAVTVIAYDSVNQQWDLNCGSSTSN